MLVSEVMTRRAETIGPDESVQAAARRMRESGVGVLVVSEGDHPVGILTDRDIVVRSTADGRDPASADVRSVMTAQLLSCLEDLGLAEAAALMEERAVRRLAVLDDAGVLVGMLSVDDVALVRPELAGEIVEHVRAPERPVPRGPPWPWWQQ